MAKYCARKTTPHPAFTATDAEADIQGFGDAGSADPADGDCGTSHGYTPPTIVQYEHRTKK